MSPVTAQDSSPLDLESRHKVDGQQQGLEPSAVGGRWQLMILLVRGLVEAIGLSRMNAKAECGGAGL